MKKSSRKIQSVYRNQNALVRAVFERAGDARKVLCVALDYAKRKHVALICDGHGDVLKASFSVENNAAGIAHLIKEVSATARRRKIPKDQIFLGGEDEAAYIANFTEALRAKGYLVVRVNAYEAKENRENLLASTDTLDLLGIAKTLLSRRARITGDTSSSAAAYHHLREITRCRRTLVRQQTAASNRIHALADQLFPGFLNGSKSALTPFCDASLELMKVRFSAPEIARRKVTSLANLLRRHRVQHPDETAAQIIQLAREALPPTASPRSSAPLPPPSISINASSATPSSFAPKPPSLSPPPPTSCSPASPASASSLRRVSPANSATPNTSAS